MILCRYVVIVFDEMKIREDLVFDKATGYITGFVDFGEHCLNGRFTALKDQCKQQREVVVSSASVATHMLTVMVRGLFFKLDFPLAQFASTG